MNNLTKENISFDAAVLVKGRKVESLFLQVHSQEHVRYSCMDESCGSKQGTAGSYFADVFAKV